MKLRENKKNRKRKERMREINKGRESCRMLHYQVMSVKKHLSVGLSVR
jgi:hypothetical protein